MIINADSLRKDTVALIKQIDNQIAEVTHAAEQMGISPERVRDSHGNWPMIQLLQAKAQAYNTLVLLQPSKK